MMRDEASVQAAARLLHCKITRGQIWRNNSGAYMDDQGRMVRYGLANESAQENKLIKSADLIGITPVLIQPHMIGYTLGVFTAYECKPQGWHLRPGDKRGLAQERFLSIVKESCGFAGFVTDPGDILKVIGRE